MTSIDDKGRSDSAVMRVLIVAALTMAVVSTLGTPLIPEISAKKNVSLEDAQWMLTVTMLVGAIATPVIGRLGDGSRRKRVLIATLATVFVGLVITASAGSFAQMLIGRGIQGVGYGTVPLAIAYARHHIGPDLQARAIAALSVTVAVGAGLGYPLTGLIAQLFDFHVAFWFGALCCAASLTAVALLLPSDSGADHKVRVDYVGAAILGAGLTALLVAISRGASWGWSSNAVLGLLGASFVLLTGWGWFEMRSADPIIDLRLSAKPAVLGANTGALLMGAGMFIGMSLVNRLVQTPTSAGYGFGASLFVSGLVLLPLSFGSLVAQPIARTVTERRGVRVVLPAGAVAVAITLLVASAAHDHLFELFAVTAMLGVGIGTTFAAMPALIVSQVPHSRVGSAMSTNQVLRSVGGALGSAIAASVLAAKTPTGSIYPTSDAYTLAFLIGSALCVVAGVAAFALVPARRAQPVEGEELALLMQESGTSAGVGPSIFDGEDGD